MATLESLTVELGIDTDRLRAGAERAKRTLAGLGKAVGALGAGAPAIAAVATAAGGLAAAFASAGAAAGAFTLAIKPQLKAMQESADAADKLAKARETEARKKVVADKLSARGSDLAEKAAKAYTTARLATVDAEEAYARQTKGLPKATADAALALAELKNETQSWSDSLASTTMPVFTKGIQLLRSLLPSLTPLVQAASRALSRFLNTVKGDRGGIARFMQDLAGSAEQNLGAFLRSLRNIGIGVAGIIRAFLGVSDNMSGGVERATARFAEFGRTLSNSAGFAQFIALAKQGAQTVATLGAAAVTLLAALGPLIGITTQLALLLANMINAIPAPVLTALASAVLAVVVGLKIFNIVAAITSAVTRAWSAAQWLLNSALLANPITWIVLAIVALIAVIVLIATKTDWFQRAWKATWGAIKAVAKATVFGIKSALGWFKSLGSLFKGWFNAAKNAVVRAFNATVDWVKKVPGRIRDALSSLSFKIASVMLSAGNRFISSAKSKMSAAVGLIKGLPGRAKSALGNLGSILWGAGKSLINGFINGIKNMFGSVKNTLGNLTDSLTSWKGPESLDKRVLTPNGEMVIGGFMRGIQNSVPALRRQLSGVTGDLTNMAVGVTPSGVFRTSNSSETRVVFDVTGADNDMKQLIRRIVRTDGRGNVQTAFGR